MEKGAEAVVKNKDGKMVKKRPKKIYRHSSLDKRIRESRTAEEKKNIDRARKYGANVPETSLDDSTTLIQERVEGEKLRDLIEEQTHLLKAVGEQVALLHDADIVHGDLTTSNIIYDGEINIIDFGLSEVSDRTEDKAVDIHLLKQVLRSSHPENAEEAWKLFLEGYSDYEKSSKVLERLEKVESRGRYK